jgi:hypothetical protein
MKIKIRVIKMMKKLVGIAKSKIIIVIKEKEKEKKKRRARIILSLV